MLYEADILASWQMDEHDYTTACAPAQLPKLVLCCLDRFVSFVSAWSAEAGRAGRCGHCAKKFVARFRVRRAGADAQRGAEGPESFECLSPLVVKKELTTLMRSIDEPEEVERMRRARPDGLTAAVARDEGF
eukprot:1563897-Rhodomonas_salina.1